MTPLTADWRLISHSKALGQSRAKHRPMDCFNAITTMFSQSDIDLSENVERILARKCQFTVENLVAVCRDSVAVRARLKTNSKLNGDTVIVLALKYRCEELFKCIIELLASEISVYKQLNREALHHVNSREKLNWIASMKENEIKWIMKQALEAPTHDVWIKEVVNSMDNIGRNLNMFCTGYNPLAHAIYVDNRAVYQKLTRSKMGHIRWLDGESILFYTVRTMDLPLTSEEVKPRIKMWEYLMTEENLLESQSSGTNLFIRAIESNDMTLVRYLIENHLEILHKLSSDELPLITAIKVGSIQMVYHLLHANFSPTEENKIGITPFQATLYSDCVRLPEAIIDAMVAHEIYTVDNLCRAMSANRWWLAKEIFEGIERTCDWAEAFGEGKAHEVLQVQIDIMTTRREMGRPQQRLGLNLPIRVRRNWCRYNTVPEILRTHGRDWWDLSCLQLHRFPGITLDTAPRI